MNYLPAHLLMQKPSNTHTHTLSFKHSHSPACLPVRIDQFVRTAFVSIPSLVPSRVRSSINVTQSCQQPIQFDQKLSNTKMPLGIGSSGFVEWASHRHRRRRGWTSERTTNNNNNNDLPPQKKINLRSTDSKYPIREPRRMFCGGRMNLKPLVGVPRGIFFSLGKWFTPCMMKGKRMQIPIRVKERDREDHARINF